MKMRLRCLVCCLLAGLGQFTSVSAETPAVLEEAVQKWNAGKEDLAFTERVRTFFDDGRIKEERVERYDPSLADDQRWHLAEVNGKPPTEAQRERLELRKNRRPRKGANKPLGDYFAFEHAKQLGDENNLLRYEVPVRSEAARLLDVEKLNVVFSVSKTTNTIEHVSVGLREPMRIALGLVRVTDVDLDVHFDPSSEVSAPVPRPDQPSSSAHVIVSKFGDRSEYTWSNFRRVTSFHSDDSSEATARAHASLHTGE